MKKMTIATVALVAALSAFPRDVSIVVDVAAKPIASVDYSAAGAKLGAGPAMAKQDDFHALVARTKRAFAAFDRGKTDVSPFNGKTDRIWTRYLSLALRDHRKALAHGKDGDFEYLSLEGRGQNCIVAVNPGAEPVKLTVTLKGRQSGDWVLRRVSADAKTGAVTARAWGGYCKRGSPVTLVIVPRSLSTITYRAR